MLFSPEKEGNWSFVSFIILPNGVDLFSSSPGIQQMMVKPSQMFARKLSQYKNGKLAEQKLEIVVITLKVYLFQEKLPLFSGIFGCFWDML